MKAGTAMTGEYDRPRADRGGIRLHLNENTGGCSPAVLAALRSLTEKDAAFYPDYEAAYQAVVYAFGVPEDHLVLTNGLDEGILTATGAAFRDRGNGIPEGLGVFPAFDMYEVCTEALGGRMVMLPLDGDYAYPWDALRAAVTDRTRIVYVTNPHNPTGQSLALDDIVALARAVAPVMLFVDEAYADFTDETLISSRNFSDLPNVVVGRTFAKAYGLAGLRVGALFGHPDTLAPIRRIVPPYTLNIFATVALPVALGDRQYREWYVAQVAESRRMLSDACARLGFPVSRSVANFMLVNAGARARWLVEALAARHVFVRDRSSDPGCAGCIRMTTGLVADTERLITAIEEVWCGAPR
jgi:histidinol-phosphate aminotransferase